ncbi:MAG: DEAD/DEAH box helicase [Spirochaetales bacterium]|nr:DEAD/DEAH box helicase [Spirochaetales bacterium]
MNKKKLALRLRKNYGHLNFEPSLHDGRSFFYYREGEINLSDTESRILDRARNHRGDILTPELLNLIEHSNFPEIYYTPEFSRPQKMSIKPIGSWAAGFRYYSLDKFKPLFIPVIYPEGEEDMNKTIPLVSDFFQNHHYLYTMEKGTVHLIERDPVLVEIVKSFKNSGPFSLGEAREILDSFQMQGIETVEEFPEFEFHELNSFPILEMSKGRRNELHLTLYFDYEGIKRPFRNLEESIILEQTPEKILFSRRDLSFEQAICSRCLYTFGREVRTKIFEAVQNYNFSLTMDMDEFLAKYGEELLNYGIQLKRKQDRMGIVGRGRIFFRLKEEEERFQIKALVNSENGSEPIELDTDLLEQNYAAGNRGLYIIDREHIHLLQALYGLGMGKDGELRTCRNNIGVVNLIYNALEDQQHETVLRLRKLEKGIENFDIEEAVRISGNFKGGLRDYQQAGVNWLHFLHRSGLNGCLADDMGLGKTVQTLAFLQNLYDQGELKRVLIVAPVSTLPNWENEIKRFCPGLSCLRHAGTDRTGSTEDLKTPVITLVSYQTLRNDIIRFREIDYTYVILDEAQYIKNAGTQAFKSVRVLRSFRRLSLTGTPVENRTMDLWSQMDFLNPGLLGPVDHFQKRFIVPIEEKEDREKREQLKKIVYPFILRRKKEDVLDDLPPRSEIVRYTEMAPDQAALYRQLLDKYRKEIFQLTEKKGIAGAQIDILQALMKLRQAVLFPAMLGKRYKDISSRKFDVLKLHLRDITSGEHKVLIFSQFVKSLSLIKEWLEEENIDYSYLDGATKNRQKEIEHFQEDRDCKVFLISLKAGGTGINLTAADYVIIFDPWWNPAAEAQAIDRTHRIGQTRPVTAFRFIMKNTIEEKIMELQNRKKELMQDLIATEESIFKSMTKEDLEELFKLS